jgi:hypothetical protein
MAVATGSQQVSTLFDVPPDIETGASKLYVVANGVPSPGRVVTVAIPGVVKSLSLSPPEVKGGNLSTATVGLEHAVAIDTIVSISLQEVAKLGHQPLLPQRGPIARAPLSITIPAGQLVGSFPISTQTLSGSQPIVVVVDVGTGETAENKVATLTVHA